MHTIGQKRIQIKNHVTTQDVNKGLFHKETIFRGNYKINTEVA